MVSEKQPATSNILALLTCPSTSLTHLPEAGLVLSSFSNHSNSTKRKASEIPHEKQFSQLQACVNEEDGTDNDNCANNAYNDFYQDDDADESEVEELDDDDNDDEEEGQEEEEEEEEDGVYIHDELIYLGDFPEDVIDAVELSDRATNPSPRVAARTRYLYDQFTNVPARDSLATELLEKHYADILHRSLLYGSDLLSNTAMWLDALPAAEQHLRHMTEKRRELYSRKGPWTTADMTESAYEPPEDGDWSKETDIGIYQIIATIKDAVDLEVNLPLSWDTYPDRVKAMMLSRKDQPYMGMTGNGFHIRIGQNHLDWAYREKQKYRNGTPLYWLLNSGLYDVDVRIVLKFDPLFKGRRHFLGQLLLMESMEIRLHGAYAPAALAKTRRRNPQQIRYEMSARPYLHPPVQALQSPETMWGLLMQSDSNAGLNLEIPYLAPVKSRKVLLSARIASLQTDVGIEVGLRARTETALLDVHIWQLGSKVHPGFRRCLKLFLDEEQSQVVVGNESQVGFLTAEIAEGQHDHAFIRLTEAEERALVASDMVSQADIDSSKTLAFRLSIRDRRGGRLSFWVRFLPERYGISDKYKQHAAYRMCLANTWIAGIKEGLEEYQLAPPSRVNLFRENSPEEKLWDVIKELQAYGGNERKKKVAREGMILRGMDLELNNAAVAMAVDPKNFSCDDELWICPFHQDFRRNKTGSPSNRRRACVVHILTTEICLVALGKTLGYTPYQVWANSQRLFCPKCDYSIAAVCNARCQDLLIIHCNTNHDLKVTKEIIEANAFEEPRRSAEHIAMFRCPVPLCANKLRKLGSNDCRDFKLHLDTHHPGMASISLMKLEKQCVAMRDPYLVWWDKQILGHHFRGTTYSNDGEKLKWIQKVWCPVAGCHREFKTKEQLRHHHNNRHRELQEPHDYDLTFNPVTREYHSAGPDVLGTETHEDSWV